MAHVPAASRRAPLSLARGLPGDDRRSSASARSAAPRPGPTPVAPRRPSSRRRASRRDVRRRPPRQRRLRECRRRGGRLRRAGAPRRRLSLRHRRQHPGALGIPAHRPSRGRRARRPARATSSSSTRGAWRRQPECADRAGIVESVGAGGRITFVEAQGGRVRRSFVDPAHPSSRRDARGEILNSFLRPIRIDDPPGARYFAGEMLCGVARTDEPALRLADRQPSWRSPEAPTAGFRAFRLAPAG